MKIIYEFDGFSLFVEPAPSVKPGKQVIGVYPATAEAMGILRALTGGRGPVSLDVDGTACAVAPHDEQTDKILTDMVDIIVAIRRAAPEIVQLAIEGFGNG